MRLLTTTLLLGGICMSANAETVTVRPTETDELLANPGMGWQTFHRFADEDPALDGLPSSSAYFRFYWSEIEPEEGKIDFEMLDGMLEQAHESGQRLAFRIMCVGTNGDYMHVPAWLKEKGCPGFEFQYGGDVTQWVPDMDHEMFQEAHFRTIRALGERYDGHPDVDLLDIGTVGLWGEWHMSQTGVELPTEETRIKIIDEWRSAFPSTPTVMLIGDAPGMAYCAKRSIGWRADCLGDMGGFSETWNHMDNMYKQQLEKTDALDAWKTGPVAFESCWTMLKWAEEAWDIRYIFDYALELHASYLNNKSAVIPTGARPEVERFLRSLGYRLVLRELTHEKTVKRGEPLTVEMTWANVGVAPPYGDYTIAVRLTPADGPPVVLDGQSVKGWLPGEHTVELPLPLLADLTPGVYQMAVALTDPQSGEPAIRLAIEGRDDDGWYPLSEFEVTE